MPDEPLHHIERPGLPWRTDERLTECRLDADAYPTWTREEARIQANKLGRTRFYMVTCVTCIHTYGRYQTWDTNPVSAMARECERHRFQYGTGPDPKVTVELRAIALLIEAHRGEFDELISGLGQVENLADRRKARRHG